MSEPESQAERFGRLYAASSAINRAVARSRSRDELENEVVRVLVETGGFAMSFLAWNDPATNRLVPTARFGDKGGYAENIHMFSDDRPEGQGPAGTAFRSGTPYVCDDFMDDPRTLPWRETAKANGWRASAAFPVSIGGRTSGILSVYSLEPGEFAADRVELLEQVALDLAFGIDHLEGEAQRRQTEEALAASERRLQQAIRVADIGIFDHDHIANTIYLSPRDREINGLGPDEAVTLEMFIARVHPGDRERIGAAVQSSLDPSGDGAFDVENRLLLPDGTVRWTSTRAQTFF
jgi:GAF domain-containing protein